MQMKRRVEHLEQVYLPDSKRHNYYLWEGLFLIAFDKKYGKCVDSAPEVLRRWYERLANRRVR